MRSMREYMARGMSEMGGWFAARIFGEMGKQHWIRANIWYCLYWCVLCRYWETVILFYGKEDCGKGYKGW